jgi:hypothetical protein
MRIVLPLILLIVSVALLGAGWNSYVERQELIDSGTQVQGVIVDVRSSTDSEGDTTYAPVYEYSAAGRKLRHEPSVKTSSMPRRGDTETLYVDPDDADHVIADTFADRWFAPMMFGIFGMLSLISAVVLAVTLRRVGRRSSELGPHTANHDSHSTVTQSTASSTSMSTTSDSADSSGPFVSGGDSDSRGPFS